MSLMEVIWIPLVEKARIDDSRPAPTPDTTTETSFTPIAAARSPTSSPTLAAANGVPFLAPENPSEPDDDQVTMLPDLSPKHILVLLKVASTYSMPVSSLRLERVDALALAAPSPPPFLTMRFFPIFLYVFRKLQQLRFALLAATGAHGLAYIAAHRAGVGLGSLSARREPLGMAHSAVRSAVFEALDVAGNLALEVALEFEPFELFADCVLLLRGQLVSFLLRINLGFLEYRRGARRADAVQSRQGKYDSFIRNCDA